MNKRIEDKINEITDESAITVNALWETSPCFNPVKRIIKENSDTWDKLIAVLNIVCFLNPKMPKSSKNIKGFIKTA